MDIAREETDNQMPRLDLVTFLVLNRIKPQAPLLVVSFRQSLHVSGLRPCSFQNHKTLISQLDVWWFGLRPFPRARICDWTSKALKASTQLATLDLHFVTAVAVFLVHTEHGAWHVVPTDNRRENHARSVAGKSSRTHTAAVVSVLNGVLRCHGSCRHVHPVLTPVPRRRTHSSQRPQRLQNCLSGSWCLAFRDCRQWKDTQQKVHRHQQIHLRTCHCQKVKIEQTNKAGHKSTEI